MTNIVVVQFSELVQTSRDKRYNLTCLFGGPGEAVVTSGYIGAGFVPNLIHYALIWYRWFFLSLVTVQGVRHRLSFCQPRIFLTRVFVY